MVTTTNGFLCARHSAHHFISHLILQIACKARFIIPRVRQRRLAREQRKATAGVKSSCTQRSPNGNALPLKPLMSSLCLILNWWTASAVASSGSWPGRKGLPLPSGEAGPAHSPRKGFGRLAWCGAEGCVGPVGRGALDWVRGPSWFG